MQNKVFFENPKNFSQLKSSVKSSTDAFAAGFLGAILSEMDQAIRNTSWSNGRYTIHRNDTRTLISSVGDYKSKTEKNTFTHLLEDLIGLEKNERFTEVAESFMLCEALKTSYAEAAKVLPSKQEITKTTVMNKVHSIADEIPDKIYDKPRTVPYLHIEADEDHVAEQHGRYGEDENASFISKLVYLYEYRQESADAEGRYELVNKYYFSGLYPGTEGNKQLWSRVNAFIETNYDTEALKRVFISGDGAGWIKSGVTYVDNSVFCADKYHLMKYVNAAAQMLDEKDDVKKELWHLMYSKQKNARKKFDAYTTAMMNSVKKPEKIEELRNILAEHYNQAESYIERMQAHIPNGTVI